MTGPTPTTGQLWAGHLIVAFLSAAVVHAVMSEMKISSKARTTAYLVSASAGVYAHHKFDVPVARVIAKLAA